MTNLPITVNNSQPPAKGGSGDVALPRNGSPAATANTATGAAQKNDAAAQPADPFGAVLARRIQADETNTAAPNAPPASGIDAKTMADSSATPGKTEQDKTLTAAMTGDPSSALAAMLQLPQEIKPPVAKDATAGTTARGMTDIAATAQGVIGTVMARGIAGATTIRETSTNKAVVNQSAANAGTIKTKMGFGLTDAAPGKADAAVMIADNLTAVDKSALRNGPGLGIATPAELSGSFPDAARSAQGLAQSATSVAASGMFPNMLVNDKTASNLQTVSSPLGSSGWADEFSQKITWMGTQQNQVAELHLNPPNLGPLDVVLKISDNQATALFTSPHSAVRDAVESALPRLREMLADNGIMLGNTMVSDQPPRDRSADGFIDHGAGAAVQREASGDAIKTLSSTTAQAIPARRHNGMVDTFA
ncbi:MAG: flagellar hook-length control protein FliK [Gallionella sp.]|nr:flagellar hook-length control protein FliK [Gallionella sp.]